MEARKLKQTVSTFVLSLSFSASSFYLLFISFPSFSISYDARALLASEILTTATLTLRQTDFDRKYRLVMVCVVTLDHF